MKAEFRSLLESRLAGTSAGPTPKSYALMGLSETFHFFSSKYRTLPCR